MFRLVSGCLRGFVEFVSTLVLKIDCRCQIGQLNDINVEAAGSPFGENLVVERSGLRPDVARVDLREVVVETLHDASGARLILMAVEYELAFLLGLRHVRIRQKVEDLRRGLRPCLGEHAWCRHSNEWYRGDRAANCK